MKRHFPVMVVILSAIIPGADAQIHFSPGINVGIPLLDTLLTSSSGSTAGTSSYSDQYSSKTKLLLIGPTLRLDLPRGLGFEFDALYQRVNYDHATSSSALGSYSTQSFEQGTANRWQFPLLVQYGWTIARVRPFVEAGPSISSIVGGRSKLTSKAVYVPNPPTSSTSSQALPAVTTAGITAGGGISIPFLGRHVRAEVRFSHWFTPALGSNGTYASFLLGDFSNPYVAVSPASTPFRTNQNEAAFLLGFSF